VPDYIDPYGGRDLQVEVDRLRQKVRRLERESLRGLQVHTRPDGTVGFGEGVGFFGANGIEFGDIAQSKRISWNANTPIEANIYGYSGTTVANLFFEAHVDNDNYVTIQLITGANERLEFDVSKGGFLSQFSMLGDGEFRIEDGYLGIQDGVTAPAAGSGLIRIYGDTADGNLKAKDTDGNVYHLHVITKTDTGDPTGVEGMIVINTFDNNVKIYADAAFRTLASGW
jgi:hypothetical protein